MTFKSPASGSEESRCCSVSTGGASPGVAGSSAGQSELAELFGQLRGRLDHLRTDGAAEGHGPSGPVDLAVAVVAEALAIGEAMSRLDSGVDAGADPMGHTPAIYAEIDSRYVEHRTRALRSALHGVDDYVWWGGLVTGTTR